MKIAFFRPALLFGKTIGNELQRRFLYLLLSLEIIALEIGGRQASISFEKCGKSAGTVEPYGKTGFGYGCSFLQQGFGITDPDPGKVLMRCFSVNGFKETNEVKFGKTGFVGNIIEIDGFAEMFIDEQFGLYDAFVEIYFGKLVQVNYELQITNCAIRWSYFSIYFITQLRCSLRWIFEFVLLCVSLCCIPP